MRVAAIFDIHANLPALDAVLQDIRQAGVDHVVVGGDVLPGPMPVETLSSLLGIEIPTQFIQGNGDRVVLAQMAGADISEVPEQFGRVRIANAGSVGMPFGEPGADWILLGPDVQFRHTPYDFAKAAERIQETNYPQADEFAARNVLQPPSATVMLEAFTKASLR